MKTCKKYKINSIITTIPVAKWSNVEDLVEAEFASGRAKSTSFQSCYDKFVRNPQVQIYASKVERYLKTLSTKKQLEAMSKGLSCILDIGEPDKEGTLMRLFSDGLWTRLVEKYTCRFKIAPSSIDVTLVDSWNHVIHLYNRRNGARKAKIFLNQSKSQEDLNETNERGFDFYGGGDTGFSGVEGVYAGYKKKTTRKFLKETMWLPLNKLFDINRNVVRIKNRRNRSRKHNRIESNIISQPYGYCWSQAYIHYTIR